MVIIVDNGSCFLRFGTPNVNICNNVIPSVVGAEGSGANRQIIAGERCFENPYYPRVPQRILYQLFQEFRLINSFERIGYLWKYAFEKLKLNPKEHVVLFPVPYFTEGRIQYFENIIKTFFDTLHVPGICIAYQPQLILEFLEERTAIVVDIGDKDTLITAIYENNILSYCRCNIGGENITQSFQNLVNQKGYSFFTSDEIKILREIKEKLVYFNISDETFKPKTFELPDGYVISFGEELYEAPECFFEGNGIHKSIISLVSSFDDTILKKELANNIILAGGSSAIPGFTEKLEQELNWLSTEHLKFFVHCAPSEAIWKGASKRASQSDFHEQCISYQDYKDLGTSIISTFYPEPHQKIKSAKSTIC